MGTRKRRYLGRKIVGAVVLLFVLDLTAALMADRVIRSRPNFFESVVSTADIDELTEEVKTSFFAGCQWHRALIFYHARTCFSRPRFVDGSILSLFYWAPPLKSTRPFHHLHFDSTAARFVFGLPDFIIYRGAKKDPMG